MTVETPKPTSGTHHRVRKAAVKLFATKGFHGTGIRDLAVAAGLSSASLYHYMGTKEELLLDIMRTSMQHLLTAAERIAAATSSPEARVGALVQLHVLTHALQQPETTVVDNEIRALSSQGRAEIVQLRDQYERLWSEAIAEGCASGVFTATDPGMARLALLEMCSGVARWYSHEGQLSLENVAVCFTNLSYGLLGARMSAGDPGDGMPLPVVLDLVAEVWSIQIPRPGR